MKDLETNEIANVVGGVMPDPWGRGCTDPNNGKEPQKNPVELTLMSELADF